MIDELKEVSETKGSKKKFRTPLSIHDGTFLTVNYFLKKAPS